VGEGLGDDLIRRIARFEDGLDGKHLEWLGGPKGLLVGFLLLIPATGLCVLALIAMFGAEETFGGIASKVIGLFMLLVVAATTAYWRRQRLAAHFEFAHRLMNHADGGERQRGMTEMIVNARRGRAEHRRIAGALSAYLRHPLRDQVGEAARRQVALSLLADYTLQPAAKERLDLTGASLAGLRAVDADLAGVCLRDADLTNVRFTRANLAHADLLGARLDGADFTGARLEGTILAPSALARR
jgi:hypothetical protein